MQSEPDLKIRNGHSERGISFVIFGYNHGQNSLGQMFFALKEAFPVC